MRGISHLIAVLGLVAVAVAVALIGYTAISSYFSRSVKPSYELTATYAKLVLITDSEYVGTTRYVVYKMEVGVGNPGKATQVTLCIVAPRVTTSGLVTDRLPNCPTVSVETGYSAYSAIIRIPYNTLVPDYCGDPRTCPSVMNWQIEFRDAAGKVFAILKPVYIVP